MLLTAALLCFVCFSNEIRFSPVSDAKSNQTSEFQLGETPLHVLAEVLCDESDIKMMYFSRDQFPQLLVTL